MRHIAVIGAGVVGLATAYELSRQNFRVSVYEANDRPGQETSKANGAQLSYSFVSPLASPAVLKSLHKLLLERNGALRLRPHFEWAQFKWLIAFTLACSVRRNQAGAEDLLALGVLSRHALDDLLERHPIDFSHNRNGKLQVFESDSLLAQSHAAQTPFLASHGVEQKYLNASETVALEPSLAPIEARIKGGLFTPSEEAGDCEQLCLRLMDLLQSHGVQFHFNTPIVRLQKTGNKVQAITKADSVTADDIVLTSGIGTSQLLRPLGLDARIYPLRGYSLSYTLNEGSKAPQVSVSDIRNKVVYARIGNQLRVAGMIDIGVNRSQSIAHRIETLKQQVNEFLPELQPVADPTPWTGERAARPDSKPVIGASNISNLYLNVGHGALGFTLAFGSARLLADSLIGNDNNGLINRFRP